MISQAWRADRTWRLLALSPFLGALIADLLPANLEQLLAQPPDIVGIPLGIALQAGLLVWATLGVVLVWTARHRAIAALALGACSAVALVGIVLTPSIVALF